MPPSQAPYRNPEILSAEAGRLAMPLAVDVPADSERPEAIVDIVERTGQVGISSVAGEIKVEPVKETDIPKAVKGSEDVLEGTDAPVRNLTPGHIQLIFRPLRPRRRGGGGGWWYIRKYLRIPGISDKDDD